MFRGLRVRPLAVATALGMFAAMGVIAAMAAASGAAGAEKTYSATIEAKCVLAPGILNVKGIVFVTTTATGPESLEEGSTFQLHNATAAIDIPAEWSDEFYAEGATTVRGRLTVLEANLVGGEQEGKTTGINLATPPEYPAGLPFEGGVETEKPGLWKIPSGPEAKGSAYTFAPVKVTGAAGTDLKLSIGTAMGYEGVKSTGKGIQFKVTGYMPNGEIAGLDNNIKLSCTALDNTVLAEVPITGTTTTVSASAYTSGGTTGSGSVSTETSTCADESDFHCPLTGCEPTCTSTHTASESKSTSSSGSSTSTVTVMTTDTTMTTTCVPYTLTPELVQVEPGRGSASGGTTVTITGANLGGVTEVRFGSKPAASFEVLPEGKVRAVTPPGTGTVSVAVLGSPGGCHRLEGWGSFTYEPPPIETIQYNSWPLSGSITPRNLGQPITLPAGSTFSGSGELNDETGTGTEKGSISVPAFKSTVKLLGLPITLGVTLTQASPLQGAIVESTVGNETLKMPAKLNLGITSVGLLGLTVPTSCSTTEPLAVSLGATAPTHELLKAGFSGAGTTTISTLRCSGGFLGAVVGELFGSLLSGSGASYSLAVKAPGG